MKGIVLHGGSGTRLRPLTHTGPKQLIPIANKPMSMYAVNSLLEAGIRDLIIVVSPLGEEAVRAIYGDGTSLNARIKYVVQPKPMGIAQAIGLCREHVGDERFVVYLADNMMQNGIAEYLKQFLEFNADAFLLMSEVPNPEKFGVVVLDSKTGRIVRLVEKPREHISSLALVGIYFLSNKVFPAIDCLKPSWRGEYEITEALQSLISSGCKVEIRKVEGWWKDTGTVPDVLEANRLVLKNLKMEIMGSVDESCRVIGDVRVEPGARVHGGSVLRGPCIIGQGSEIGPSACIGPYSSIGKEVHVRNTEIDNSIVIDYCKISCGGRVIDSIIGASSVLESASGILPHGVRIVVGENSAVMT